MTNNKDKHMPNQETDTKGNSSLDISQIAQQAVDQFQLEHLDTSNVSADALGEITNDIQQEAYEAQQINSENERLERIETLENKQDSTFTDAMCLKLTSDETPSAIIKAVQGELVVGRGDNVTDYQPDIDLTPHGAYRLGLSRRHAIIVREGDSILVKDLNSRNGTFVNNVLVPSGGTKLIHDGDDIRFGNLIMHATFEK